MKSLIYVLLAVISVYFVITLTGSTSGGNMSNKEKKSSTKVEKPGKRAAAVFAGGCFWCTESDFEKIDGVIEVISGYTGGHVENPTYKQVSSGGTGHIEAVRVIYDPDKISYEYLLEVFWRMVNPTDGGGQFVDRGNQYVSAVFYENDEQKKAAEASKKKLDASNVFEQPVVTKILPLKVFYQAEDYHQNYYKKNSIRYAWYRSGSGRDRFLEDIWGDNSLKERIKNITIAVNGDGEKAKNKMSESKLPEVQKYSKPENALLKEKLTKLQFDVTQKNGTEPPFQNAYWNNHEEGIYVDVVSGEPLFSSTDKFDSGTGWPSFTRPLATDNIVEKQDVSLFMVRTEVRSKNGDSHLGHVFDDGPAPTNLRYCINSASLKFIPAESLEKEGYGEFRRLFE